MLGLLPPTEELHPTNSEAVLSSGVLGTPSVPMHSEYEALSTLLHKHSSQRGHRLLGPGNCHGRIEAHHISLLAAPMDDSSELLSKSSLQALGQILYG